RVPVEPLVRGVGGDRQVGVVGGRPGRVEAGVVVGGVLGVDVEPVERVGDVGGGLLERGRAGDRGRVVEHLEADDGVDLVLVGGAQRGVRDRCAADGGAGLHDAEVGAERDELVGAGR